jgi:EAL and modified HD-GYP domain-containing signal transduction protein
MDESEIFVGRQPILDREQKLIAFELLFRRGRTQTAGVTNDTQATASVIANSFGALGLSKVLEGHQAFINFSAPLLMSDLVNILPPDRVIIEILETVDIDQGIIGRIEELKKRGFKFALDDIVSAEPKLNPLRGLIDVIKLDLKQVSFEALPTLIADFKRWPVRLLAEKIDGQQQAQLCLELGIDLFQGYHFARPQIIAGRRLDPSKVVLLRLLSLVLNDASDQHIEEQLKRLPYLTLNLLRIVNSVAYGTVKKVSSVSQCLVMLGRRQLQRWVQVMLYASSQQAMAQNPLLHTAVVRARLMETLSRKQPHSGQPDRAFMVGILSLLDVLLGVPMREIVTELPIETEVKEALTDRAGWEGKLLSLIESKEANEVNAVHAALHGLGGITLAQLTEADFEAVTWVDQLVGS